MNEDNKTKAFKNALKIVGAILLTVITIGLIIALFGGSLAMGFLKLKALINLSGI